MGWTIDAKCKNCQNIVILHLEKRMNVDLSNSFNGKCHHCNMFASSKTYGFVEETLPISEFNAKVQMHKSIYKGCDPEAAMIANLGKTGYLELALAHDKAYKDLTKKLEKNMQMHNP